MLRLSLVAASCLLAGVCSAQKMGGAYTINPNGTGARNFTSFLEASKNLFFFGIAAPVEMVVSPGTYKEEFFLLPVEGASATNTIKFRPQVPVGVTVRLESVATNGTIATMFPGVSALPGGFYIFDGFTFNQGGTAIEAGANTSDITIQNCVFESAFSPSRGVIYCEGAASSLRWMLKGNTFKVPASRRGIYGSQIGSWVIDRNTFELGGSTGGAGEALYLINNNNSQNDISNNLFYGAMRNATTPCIAVDLSNINNEVVHNTIVLDTGDGIQSFGTSSNFNKIYGNLIYIKGSGTCLSISITSTSLQNWASDGNLLYAPNGNVGQLGNTTYATLTAWQAAPNTNQTQRDQNSISVDPQLMSINAPWDLRPNAGSPVQDAAVNTPAWLTQDFNGRYRDGTPDIGAYELNGFAVFGTACDGTGQKAPTMSATGTVKLGSAVTIKVDNGPAGAPAILAFGLSSKMFGPIPLPFNIGGCSLYVSLDVLTATGLNAQGSGQSGVGIPNLPSLMGATFYYQWLVIDQGSVSPLGFTTSEGGAINL
jgi:hypothetical protein